MLQREVVNYAYLRKQSSVHLKWNEIFTSQLNFRSSRNFRLSATVIWTGERAKREII